MRHCEIATTSTVGSRRQCGMGDLWWTRCADETAMLAWVATPANPTIGTGRIGTTACDAPAAAHGIMLPSEVRPLVLDNPLWSSLVTRHRDLALRVGDVARYSAEHAPFLGVAAASVDVAEALEALVAPGES